LLSSAGLLQACRSITTGFFRENGLDREEVAAELASLLEAPAVRVELVRHVQACPDRPEPVPPAANPPDLFISYFHEDVEFVKQLAAAVAREGYEPWYDRVGLTGGSSFPSIIERVLEGTRFVGLVASAESVARPWVRREMDATYTREGEEDREILIPLRIDDSELPLFVRTKTWCDFRGAFAEGVEQLMDVLQG
jgi:hypothetical protein